MSETIHQDSASNAPWPAGDHRVRVPSTSKLPGSEKAPPAAVDLLRKAVQGAHETIDQLADSAAPIFSAKVSITFKTYIYWSGVSWRTDGASHLA